MRWKPWLAYTNVWPPRIERFKPSAHRGSLAGAILGRREITLSAKPWMALKKIAVAFGSHFSETTAVGIPNATS
jgi:hypothetical protein